MKSQSYNKDGSLRKKGSGRPKGSTSFADISLQELINLLPSEEEIVVVSRVWLEKKGASRAVDLCNKLNHL